GIDTNQDGQITWGEIKQQQLKLSAYALSRLQLQQDHTTCNLSLQQLQIDEHTDGAYAVLILQPSCSLAANTQLDFNYQLFFDIDPTHRGILLDQRAEVAASSMIFSQDKPQLSLSPQQSNGWSTFVNYVGEGSYHIWLGLDHLLFISLLILPAVLRVNNFRWEQVESFRPALLNLLKVITAFTVAHSITLSLAALGMVSLPSRLVESAIAVSIIVLALNIFYPIVKHDQWWLAFSFGLLHGFGFASVLSELSMPQATLIQALLGFNVGVELGQLLLVLLVFPLAYLLRATKLYQVPILYGSAALTFVLASIWFVERAFDTALFV
ncbi:MAG TPA: HupE/UreJ family protein, partial [Thiolinea sp.]|nr:HupE/UreJ family protein [Thiolinea sp.]